MDYGECNSIICLDWREICDGKVDCSNGLDEYYCHELEMNECNIATEYRCSNAQCIDKVLYANYHADYYLTYCENYACPSLLFSCGDGHCYDGPNVQHNDRCRTQRDRFYFNQMPSSTLILYSHIHLIYNNTKPEMICFNQTICPYLISENESTNQLTCRLFETFTDKIYISFDDMLKDVKRFTRSCSLLPQDNQINQCSLFQCNDQSKCLSYHRLLDGIADCANEEDENHPNTCLFNLTYRFKCDNGTRCLPEQLLLDRKSQCSDKEDEHLGIVYTCIDPSSVQCLTYRGMPTRFNLSFPELCNGIIERISDVSNDTDESHCDKNEWPCSTHYTQCNKMWNCPDGSDELNCSTLDNLHKHHCNRTKHFCLDIHTGDPICLPLIRANNGVIDCVGSIDEQEFCRLKYPGKSMRLFRCQNSDICIRRHQICDCHQDCPNNDDETMACIWLNNGQEPSCDSDRFRCRNGQYIGHSACMAKYECPNFENSLFCELDYDGRVPEFKTDRFPRYPPTEIRHVIKQRDVQELSTLTNIILWQCNAGLYVRSTINPSSYFCLCPNYYYGDHCQFQRKRISLNLYLRIENLIANQIPMFKFIILLKRHDNITFSIISHEQFNYIPEKYCSPQYLIELLYPINYNSSLLFLNHSIYIHAFIANTLQHFVSWHFPLSFEFLPVRRISKELIVTNISTISTESRWVITTLMNYSNCTSCSNDSLCLGYDLDLSRDICVCPLERTGRRCFIHFNPCTKNSCNGQGRCIPVDIRHDLTKQFVCLCNKEWEGDQCEQAKSRISISLSREISIPSSLIAFIHVINAINKQEPRSFTYFHRLNRDISNFNFSFDGTTILTPHLAFIQLYEHQYQFDYYLLLLRSGGITLSHQFNTVVRSSHRCHSIDELFDQTILNQIPLRRVKKYQRPCLNQQSICFYDDKLMCLCDETNHVSCFNFETKPRECLINTCHSRGMCVQDDDRCPK
ncbi:unnamed protein product, partial [Adineta ricciae]